MNIALTSSVAGMNAAADRLAIRADNVANVLTPGYRASEVVQQSTGSGPAVSERLPVDQVGSQVSGAPGASASSQQLSLPFDNLPQDRPPEEPSPEQSSPEQPSNVSLEYEMTDMIRAEHAYKASANVVRTVGQMQDTLLDIFS